MSFNVVSALVPYLKNTCGVPVSALVPANRPTEFITIERTGGTAQLGKDAPNLAIQCWAQSELNAYTLALAVREAMLTSWQKIDQICRIEIGSIYSFPDPDSAQRRYQVDAYLVTRL